MADTGFLKDAKKLSKYKANIIEGWFLSFLAKIRSGIYVAKNASSLLLLNGMNLFDHSESCTLSSKS